MDQKPVDKKSVTEIFHQVWSQALVAVTGAEDEATKLIGRVQEALGWNQEEARRQVRDFSDRLVGQRRDVEKRVEEAVKHSLSLLKVPRREELAQLSARVDELARRMESLTR